MARGSGTPSAMWSPSRSRVLVLNGSMLHIIGIPLLILGCIGVGFVLVYLKEVLLPFIVAMFIVYLLRPMVNMLTTPFGKVLHLMGFVVHAAAQAPHRVRNRLHGPSSYQRLATSSSGGSEGNGMNSNGGDGLSDGGGVGNMNNVQRRAGRSSSPPKYPKTVRAAVARAWTNAQELYSSAARAAAAASGSGGSGGVAIAGGSSSSDYASDANGPVAPLPSPSAASGPNAMSSAAGSGGGAQDSSTGSPAGVGASSYCRMTRCPRWFAILVSLGCAASVIAGLVLLTVDAIQTFERRSLGVYKDQAGALANSVQQWFLVLGIHLQADQVLDAIKSHISVVATVHYTISVMIEGVGNALLVFLLVLYLLAEQSKHAPGSLRAKMDAQIQRYVVIKTAISGLQGLLAYVILGVILNVRMAHLFGILHFLLNYIPTAGPIIATVLPLPIIVLDPELSLAAKIAAFAGPSAVHMVVGNLLEPVVFGQNMDLHPVTVLLALAMWYALWGIPGAILAVPITAVMRIILKEVDHPYATIVICIMEGRLTAASEGLGEALDSDAGNSGLGMGDPPNGGTMMGQAGVVNGSSSSSNSSGGIDGSMTPLHGGNVGGGRDMAGSIASVSSGTGVMLVDLEDGGGNPQQQQMLQMIPQTLPLPASAAQYPPLVSGGSSGALLGGSSCSSSSINGSGYRRPVAAAGGGVSGSTGGSSVLGASSGDSGSGGQIEGSSSSSISVFGASGKVFAMNNNNAGAAGGDISGTLGGLLQPRGSG